MSRGQGEKGEAEGRESKGGGGEKTLSAQDFLPAFLIFPQFSRPNQPGRSAHRL